MKRPSTNLIVVHCAVTTADMDIGVKEIDAWHKQRGFKSCGYHFVIRRNGTIELGRDIEEEGAHAIGFNTRSVGICLAGGLADNGDYVDNFTDNQFSSLRILINGILEKYPGIKVLGHRDLPNVHKDCPCFDVRKWYAGCN